MTDNLFAYLKSADFLQSLTANRFILILLVIVFSSLKHASYRSLWMAALLNLPGTLLHETAHFMVGLVLNAKPTGFSLWPKKVDDSYVVGSVSFRNLTFYNALPAAMAPLFLLGIAYYADGLFFELLPVSVGSYLLYILVMSVIIENAMPSGVDFKAAFRHIGGVFFYLGTGFLFLYL